MAPPPTSNGVLTAPPKGIVGGNRKKQKRRAKQAAKQTSPSPPPVAASEQPAEIDYDEDPLGYGSEDYDYDDAEGTYATDANGHLAPTTSATNKKKKKKKGSTGGGGSAAAAALHQEMYNPELVGSSLPPHPLHPVRSSRSGSVQKPNVPSSNIWNTSSQQERQNIKNFWLKLSEDERKSLLKIEKEAVLRKMKQQQKHSCSCTVCGRKRTAIEEELEVLYEGYYEELENYAHTDNPPLPSTDGMVPPPLSQPRPHPLATGPPMPPHHRASRIQEEFDDDDLSEEEEEEFSEEDEDYSDDDILEPEPPRGGIPDFFNFGANLTVKGILTPWHMHLLRLAEDRLKNGVPADNLLTVADDLLKNDGRKFIEMMEQLAERRMQRESAAEFQSQTNPQQQPSSHLPGAYPGDDGYHEDPLAAGEEFDDDEASYDSQEEFEDDLEEDDEMNHLTEEQRMQEGRRMFQIFAARMFEQRVLNAYREQVAAERQATLLEELENEDKLSAAREAKKQRDAEKKKAKKLQQKQSKAEEKARKDAEKAAEEARVKEAEAKKQEEQRKRREEQRKKKEEERRKQEEERVRKEAEKARRQQEEQSRREEAERKARESKAAEKARKEEARKREREEREAREIEARERKTQEDKEKKEREAKSKAEKEAKEREKTAQQSAQPPSYHQQQPQAPQITKRPSQPGMVAVPGVYPKQTPSGLSSPHPTIATPAVPKAPTPATRQRQQSQQGSHASSPKQGQGSVSSAPSKSSSPGNMSQQQSQPPGLQRPHGLQKAPSGHQSSQGPQMPPHSMSATSPLPHTPIQPPPGMPGLPQHHPGGFSGMPPMGFQGFPHQGPMMPGLGHRGPMPGMHGFPQQHHGQPMGFANRGFGAPGMHSGVNGMPAPPPGMGMHPHGRGMSTGGFGFDNLGTGAPPPGFGVPQMPMQQSATQSQATSPIGPPAPGNAPGDAASRQPPAHSRQQSMEKERFESTANQPIARPTPIQRPSSVRPQDQHRKGSNDVEDLSKHLGSSALLDDTDEPILSTQDGRRQSNMIPGARNSLPGPIGGGFGAPGSSFGSGSNWGAPTLPFGQPSLGSQQWGVPTTGLHSWNQNQAPFAPSNTFGPLAGSSVGSSMHRPAGTSMSRPWAIRLAVCQACKQLTTTTTRGHGDGFHPVDALLSQIESATNVPLDSPPTLRELEEICETVGDSQNGGGELSVRKNTTDEVVAVKWEDNTSTPDLSRGVVGGGLGEIGSPMPSKTSPATGAFGAPGIGRPGGFQGLGAVGSGSFS